jgi:hypothetical protein
MSEILDHAPATWTPSERLVVLAIAEQANDATRRGYPGIELIAHRAGVDVGTVSRTLNRLRKKGTELRLPMTGVGSDGKVIYAVRGHRTVYEIPRLCPLPVHGTKICVYLDGPDDPVAEPERADQGPTIPPQRADGGPVFSEERADHRPGYSGERADGGPERADGGPPHPLSSPQQPSPQDVREPVEVAAAKPPKYDWKKIDQEEAESKARLGAAFGPVHTVLKSLEETDPGATEAEALAVFQLIMRQAVEANKPIKHGSYFSAIAKSGGFTMQLATVRAHRLVKDQDAKNGAATEIAAELARLRTTQPDCEHGTAAGKTPHPVSGEPLCPHCRRGIPAPREEIRQPTDGSNRVVDAYRAGWESEGHELIEMATLMSIGAEARLLIADGHDLTQLIRLAAQAGAGRNTLANTARKLSEALR